MIRVLGYKRIAVLAVLAGLNAALAAAVFLYIGPEIAREQRQLDQMRGAISTLESDLGRIRVEFGQLEVQQEEYERMKARGFFSAQDRREAEKVLEAAQKEAGIVSAVASIQPGTVEESEEAQKAGHKILRSVVSIRAEALDDVDVFRYLHILERRFPGHIAVTSLDIERKAEVTGAILRSISLGNNPSLAEARINLLWRTMIPESQVLGQAAEEVQ